MGFMFMGRVNGIKHYKHGITRTYLYLDDAGNCYLKKEKGGFVPGNWGVELGKMEACLARLDSSLATPYDEKFIVRKRNTLRQQGISLLTIEVQAHDINIH
jgi:hypothetical protein